MINYRISHDQNLNNEEIGTIVYQVGAALSFMHSKNYIHRDIKPENIGFTKLSDYKSLKITSFLTVKKRFEGEILTGINGSVSSLIFNKIDSLHGS